jgi:hypothetical protein
MRVPGESYGVPRLPDTQFYLWIRPGTRQTLVKQAFELVASGFRNT